jgi:hypothetical protein
MSWKFVFNSAASDDKWWGHIDKANKAAKDSGYKFFTWNGWVHAVDGDKTDIEVDDCF